MVDNTEEGQKGDPKKSLSKGQEFVRWLKSLKKEDKKDSGFTITVIDDPSKLPQDQKELYAQSMESIAGRNNVNKESVLEQFEDPSRKVYFLSNSSGQIVAYGRASVDQLNSGGLGCYIGMISTSEAYRGKGYATTILDEIIKQALLKGYREVFFAHTIMGTIIGDAMGRKYLERKFIPDKDDPMMYRWKNPNF